MLALFASLLLAVSPAEQYRTAVDALARQRVELASLEGAASPTSNRGTKPARAALLAAFDASLFPAWEGTPWDFYGTTETPGEGKIACGYYVTTLLRDAGFKIDRVKLAQQASERIVKTFAAEADIQRFRDVSPADVVKRVRLKHGPGLYLVGMDYHVGLLRVTESDAKLCHSAVLTPSYATCEKAEASPGMISSYHVVGPVLSDERVADWLAGRDVQLPGRAPATTAAASSQDIAQVK
jgi:hypothetical protein